MNEKEMTQHIKALTKVIEKQAEYAEQLNRNFTSLNRQISYILTRLGKLEGHNDE